MAIIGWLVLPRPAEEDHSQSLIGLGVMVDIPERTDDAADIIIYGVESEQIEEENDALNDMRYELGEIDKAFGELLMRNLCDVRDTQGSGGRAGGADAFLLLPQHGRLHHCANILRVLSE